MHGTHHVGYDLKSTIREKTGMTSKDRPELQELVDRARAIRMTKEQHAAQRRSFAYGNAAFENPSITKEMIEEEEAKLGTEVG